MKDFFRFPFVNFKKCWGKNKTYPSDFVDEERSRLKDKVAGIMDKIKILEYNQMGLNESLIEHMRTTTTTTTTRTTTTTTTTTTTINPHLILEGPVSIQKSKFIRGLDSSRNYFLSFEVMASSTSSSYALGLISITIQVL